MDAATVTNPVLPSGLDRFFRFCVSPAQEGIDEPCRAVVHDKVADGFCARHILEAGETWEGSLRELSPHPFSLKVKLQVMREIGRAHV